MVSLDVASLRFVSFYRTTTMDDDRMQGRSNQGNVSSYASCLAPRDDEGLSGLKGDRRDKHVLGLHI